LSTILREEQTLRVPKNKWRGDMFENRRNRRGSS